MLLPCDKHCERGWGAQWSSSSACEPVHAAAVHPACRHPEQVSPPFRVSQKADNSRLKYALTGHGVRGTGKLFWIQDLSPSIPPCTPAAISFQDLVQKENALITILGSVSLPDLAGTQEPTLALNNFSVRNGCFSSFLPSFHPSFLPSFVTSHALS